LEAGRFFRLKGNNVALTIGGAVTVGGSFLVQQTTNSLGAARTILAISGGHVDLSSSLHNVLTNVNGALLMTAGGVAAQIAGTVDLSGVLPAGIALEGTFGLSINQTAAA